MAAGPGGKEVGRVSIRVVPDTSNFRRDLKRELEKDDDLKVTVPVEVDSKDLREKLRAAVKEAGSGQGVEIPADLDAKGFREKVAALSKTSGGSVKVPVDLDESKLRERLAVLQATLKKQEAVLVKLDADEAPLKRKLDEAKARLSEMETHGVDIIMDANALPLLEKIKVAEAELDALGRKRVTPTVQTQIDNKQGDLDKLRLELEKLDTLDVTADVHVAIENYRAEVAALELKLAELEHKRTTVTITVKHNRSDIDQVQGALTKLAQIGGKVGGLFANLGSGITSAFQRADDVTSQLAGNLQKAGTSILEVLGGMLKIGAVSFAIAVGGAAISEAWGLVATAIAAVPAALGLVAGPIAAIAVGMDGIKKAAEVMGPAFGKVQQAVSATFEKGLLPVFQQLTNLFPTLQVGLTNIASGLVAITANVVSFLTSSQGMSLLSGIFDQIHNALLELSPSITSVVESFLLLASQSGAFDALVGAIQVFSDAFKTGVTEVINDGTLQAAFDGLGAVLGSLGTAFADLVTNGIQLFSSAAPGLQQTIDAITGFFEKFDWVALGAAVGSVFEGIATAISNIPAQTVQEISDAFVRLGDAFKSKEFTDLITKLITDLPGVIDLLGPAAEGFLRLADALANLAGPLKTVFDLFNGADQAIKNLHDFIEESDKAGRSILTGDENSGLLDSLGKILEQGPGVWDAITKSLGDLFSEDNGEQLTIPFGRGMASGFSKSLTEALSGGAGSSGIQASLTAAMSGVDVSAVLAGLTLGLQAGFQTMFTTLAAMNPAQLLLASLSASFVALGTTLSVLMFSVGQQLTTALATSIQTGMAQVAQVFITAFSGLGPLLNAAVVLLNAIWVAGFATFVATVTTSFAGINAAFIAGFSQIGVIVANALLGVQAVIIAGVTQWATTFANALLVIQAVITAGITGWSTVIATGLAQINALILTAGAGWSAGFTTAIAQITAIVQTGLQTIYNLFVANFALITSLITSTAAQWVASMTTAMDQLVQVVTAGMTNLVTAITSGMQQAVAALDAAVPLFRSAGENMGQALADGLNSKLGAVQEAAAALAQAAAAATAAAAQINSPSRVFIKLGQFIGQGLAVGLNRSHSTVQRAAKKLTAVVQSSVIELQGLTDDFGIDENQVRKFDVRHSRQRNDFHSTVESDGFGDIGDRVHDALSGWAVNIDGNGMAKLVNKSNTRRARRNR